MSSGAYARAAAILTRTNWDPATASITDPGLANKMETEAKNEVAPEHRRAPGAQSRPSGSRV